MNFFGIGDTIHSVKIINISIICNAFSQINITVYYDNIINAFLAHRSTHIHMAFILFPSLPPSLFTRRTKCILDMRQRFYSLN